VSWDLDAAARVLGSIIVLAPLSALIVTASIAVFETTIEERTTNRLVQASMVAGLGAAVAMTAVLAGSGRASITVDLGDWVALPEQRFHFSFKLLFDGASVVFLLLTLVLSGVVGAFARVYLHREPGYRRFYLLFTVFVLGMSLSSIAGTIEVLFAGWELVGLSSALLVAFFQERAAPVRNGLRVWAVYRVADAAFLAGALALHHGVAGGDFVRMTDGAAPIPSADAFVAGALLLVAAAGKSSLLPFSGWLPRAMEGPTPSSAIFYGALSVHLGAFLLLRLEPLIARSVPLAVLVVALGLATALWATIVARVQTDIKSAIAYAALTQVGLIVAEIGLGLRHVALVHLVGHACLRTLQLLRAPSLLHDYHRMENAIGGFLLHDRAASGPPRRLAGRLAAAAYRIGYERGLFDIVIDRAVVAPLRRALRASERLEARWTRWLSGGASAGQPAHHGDRLDPWQGTR